MTNFDSWLSPTQRGTTEAISPNDFKTVEFMTADEKRRVLDQWRKLMTWLAANGVPSDMPKVFTKVIYKHLITHAADFIAHYDQQGWWHAQLASPAAAMEFFKGLERNLLCRWGALNDYADVNSAMMDVARKVRPAILGRLALDDQQMARAQIAALAKRAGFATGVGVAEAASQSIARTSAARSTPTPMSMPRSPAPATRLEIAEAQSELF